MSELELQLRPLTVDDLALAAEWLARPHVIAGWGDEGEAWCADTRSELEAGGPSVYRIAELGGAPVGLIFYYRVHDYAEYVDEFRDAGLDVPVDAWSMDYLIGEHRATARGVGSGMIRLACEELWRTHPDAATVIVPVHATNEHSWKALLRAGFERLPGTYDFEPDIPSHDRQHVICRLDRPC
ncbi:MAG: GNAT family N-acetyltransferase [Dermatophilus congolensis]|nr:GNAT family N-acetyltransferase [Dermatophilus congolensis]